MNVKKKKITPPILEATLDGCCEFLPAGAEGTIHFFNVLFVSVTETSIVIVPATTRYSII